MIHLHLALERAPPEMRPSLMNAEGFDFGPVPLKKLTGEKEGFYELPEFTSVELELFVTGLLQLPAPVCWFEYRMETLSAILVLEDEKDSFIVHHYDEARGWATDPVFIGFKRKDKPFALYTFGREAAFFSRETIELLYGSDVGLVIYFCLMLLSKTTEIEKVRAPKFTNAARIKKGKPPLKAHTIVHIVPYKYISASQREAGRSHASPRLHWRRSHLRIYDHRTPGSTYVESKGWCVPIARCLVGSAAEGEVSHEYFVDGPLSLTNR